MTSPRLAWYGDDFSGSTDVMEVLAQARVPTRLFLDPPAAEAVAGLGAVGVAGVSRSLPTAEMEAVLRPVFEKLQVLGVPLVHYKVCSTFDSSPTVGSIGRAIDVGASVFGGPCIPLVVGAPALGRYVAFGHLFARSGLDSPVYRLDRHPTMSRHPVTPMNESDLRRVLAEQTERSVELIDATELDSGPAALSRLRGVGQHREHPDRAPVLLFDTMGEHHLPLIGQVVWNVVRRFPPVFAVGSSGLEHALAAHWKEADNSAPPPEFRAEAVDRVVVVSGSCSPVTARQIGRALANGWRDIPVSPEAWLGGDPGGILPAVHDALASGHSAIVHAATGPDDPRLEAVRRRGVTDTGPRLGRFLGAVLNRVLADPDLRRIGVAGGDTSGFVARELGVQSLEFVAPLAPGSPLCRMHAPGRPADGREITFKGGQVGKADFFDLVRSGRCQT
jgi:uncharacterized protein YgbK (DUF1537 family)